MPVMTELTRESSKPQTPEKPNSFISKFLNTKVSRREFNKGLAKTAATVVVAPHLDTAETVLGIGKKIVESTSRAAEAAEITSLDELSEVNVSRESLELNPQDIKAVTYVEDPITKDITKKFAIVQNSNMPSPVLYESHINPSTNKFTEYKAVSPKIDMANPLSMTCSSDGNTIIIGGDGGPNQSGATKLIISYDAGKTFKDIPWPYQLSGGTIDLIRINDTTYIGNNGNYEGGVGQFIITLDPQSQTTSVAQVNLETVSGVNINAGGATDFGIMSVDSQNNTLKAISAGTQKLQQGFNIFEINYATRQGTVENVTTVTMDGVANYNLGYVYGRGTYVDSQGHTHVKVSNTDRRLLFDIDLETKTGTKTDYSTILDNKGIPNYMNGRLTIFTVDVPDSQGNNTFLGGYYVINGDNSANHGVLIHLESGNFWLLAPTPGSHAPLIDQRNMKRKKINGKSIYDLVVRYLGKSTIETNSDGSPIPNASIYLPNKGLGSAFLPENTPTPTPTLSPTPTEIPPTPSSTPSSTPSPTATETPPPTPSPTEAVPTQTQSPTPTVSSTPTTEPPPPTHTESPTPTSTATRVVEWIKVHVPLVFKQTPQGGW